MSVNTQNSIVTINPFSYLNRDVYPGIFGHLNRFELAKISTVCKEWNAVINDVPQPLWRHLAAQHFQIEKFYFPSLLSSETFDPLEVVTKSEETLEQEVKKVYSICSKTGNIPVTLLGNTLIRSFYEKKDIKITEPFPGTCFFNFQTAVMYYLERGFEDNVASAFDIFKKLATYFERHCPSSIFDRHDNQFVVRAQPYLDYYAKYNPEKKFAVILMELFNKNLVVIQGLFSRFCASAERKQELFEEIAKLQPADFNWKQTLLSGNHRKYNLSNLCAIRDQLIDLSQEKFDNSRLQILKLSGKALIGLCQRPLTKSRLDPDDAERLKEPEARGYNDFFKNLPVDNSEYNFVTGGSKSISSIRVAAVLNIIQGLKSENEEVRKTALKVIFKFAKDYFEFSSKASIKTHAKEILFELARGCWLSARGKGLEGSIGFCSNIRKIFRGDIELLKEFAKLLPSDNNKSALEELINTISSSETKDS